MKLAMVFLLTALGQAGAQTTIKAAVQIGAKDEVKLGTLTVTAAKLDFEGAELLFSLPVDCIADVQVAGFREQWMTIGIRPTSDFARSYTFLLQPDRAGAKSTPARVQFLLPPNADLKAGLAIARDFKTHADAAIALRQAAADADAQTLKTRTEQEAQQRAEQQQQQKAEARAVAAPPAQERREAPTQPKVLVAINAFYLDKKPGAFIKNYGTSGELVFRDDGIGFAFHELAKLTQDRQQAAGNGNIFIPFESLQTGFVRDQKLYLGAPPTMFWLVLTPRVNSDAYARLRPFLTADGELLFTVRAIHQRDQVRSFLTRLNAGNF
jgi:hypothetical protein